MAENTGFQLQRRASLPSLGAETSYFRHPRCGAEHFHLHLEGGENAFLVAFRTPPPDSSGVAHILEHTVLCGSNRFPVRDPFFLMLRRSLSSFMNAMTASDWTAYPFSTRCEADYWNLMEVYLDATFHPLLRSLDFAQEGHRIEFVEPQQASELEIRGVVYNEMKGALSSPVSLLWKGLTRHLCEGSLYQHDSGGDTEVIPTLTHEALKDFHRRCYRPGNAIFMTAGDLSPQEIQQRIEQWIPAEADPAGPLTLESPPRWDQQRRREDRYPADGDDRNHALSAWLLPASRQPLERLRVQLLADLLLGTAASPLRRKLENCGAGRGLSPVSGLEDSLPEAIFACGLKDVAAEDLPLVPGLISEGLEEVCRNGIEPEQLQAALQQLEFGCREITGDAMPFALELLLEALPDLVYGDAPEPGLDPSEYLEQLRLQAEDKDFVPSLVRSQLLDNPHRLDYQLLADADMAAAREKAHRERMQQLRAGMSEGELKRIGRAQSELEQHQAQPDDPGLLPAVTVADLDPKMPLPDAQIDDNLSLYRAATNGICYLEIALPLPGLDLDRAALLPLYCACLTGLGVGELDYAATQTLRGRFLGGLGASLHLAAGANGEPMPWLSLSAKALDRHADALIEMPLQLLAEWRIDETRRIGEIRDQALARRENAIPGGGHLLAMQAAAASFSPLAALSHHSSGLAGLQQLATAEALRSPEALAEQMRSLHEEIRSGSWKLALVAGPDRLDDLHRLAEGAGLVSAAAAWPTPPLQLPRSEPRLGLVWQLPVNYCALSVPIPTDRRHPDLPALSVLSALLRHRWLHPRIREKGGAYGSGARSDPVSGSFTFFSYRDPGLEETYESFVGVCKALPDLVDDEALTEAILGQAGAISRVGSPAGEALAAFHRYLGGRSNDELRAFRDSLLKVSAADLLRVADSWLNTEDYSAAALTGDDDRRLKVLDGLGFQAQRIRL